MTEQEYLDFLAKNLNTWEKNHLFTRILPTYKADGEFSHIQSPAETFNRGHNLAIQGNCLDYTFLMKHLLEKQGHTQLLSVQSVSRKTSRS